jgi:NADH-quinone oxidoreductase subunit B
MTAPNAASGTGARTRLTMEGSEQGFATTRVDALLGWARKYSLFAYPFVTACCGMEFMALTSPRFDLARFGAEAPRFSPRQSDLLWVVGTISQRQAPVLKRIYEQMMEPKWVFAFGTCASTGGFYDNYATVPGIDKVIPTDIYVPGCPPRPEAVLDGLMLLQDKIARNVRTPGVVKPRFDPAHSVEELVQLRRSARDSRELLPTLKEREARAGAPDERHEGKIA